jgi:hypothetical protein
MELDMSETIEFTKEQVLIMINIMDTCAKRGAFEGSELESVGKFRGILAGFVQPPEDNQDSDLADPE